MVKAHRPVLTETGLAPLVLAIGTPRFADTLLDATGSLVAHEAAALMVQHPTAPPSVLVDRLKPAERGHLYGDYLSGVYALSPFHRMSRHLKDPAVHRIFDIAPKGFRESEYYRRYYALTGASDMLGVLIPAGQGDVVFMSFSRSARSRRFSLPEVRRLEGVLDVLAAAVTRHAELAGPLARRPVAAPAARSAATPAPSGLTQREAQVVHLMLEGHSARAIGEALKISGETVRVHRRHIYEKLAISSQAELFRWFLTSGA